MAGNDAQRGRSVEAEPGPGRVRPALALAVLGVAALAVAALGGELELLLPALLLAAWPASRLPLGTALPGLAALAAGPFLLALGGAAPALRPWSYAPAATAVVAAVGAALQHAARLRRRLREALADRDRLKTVDRLTGVATRAELVRQGQQLVALARRGGRPLAAMVADVDGLRAINERFELGVGDEVLRSVAARLREVLRATDVVGRLADDELAVVMPDTEIPGARAAAERARSAVADDGLFAPGTSEEIRFTVSIGLVPLAAGDEDLEALLRRADGALERAKRAGRDRVEAVA